MEIKARYSQVNFSKAILAPINHRPDERLKGGIEKRLRVRKEGRKEEMWTETETRQRWKVGKEEERNVLKHC